MHKLFLLLITLMTSCASFAQEAMVINGTTKDDSYKKVILYEVVNGRIEPIAETKVTENKFAFKFYPSYDGFYVLGRPESQQIAYYHIIYGKNKEVLNINMDMFHYDLVGKNSKENQDLAAYQTLIREVKEGSKLSGTNTFEQYFPILSNVEGPASAFKAKSKDENFLQQFNVLKKHLFAYYALSFRYSPKTKHPKQEDLIPFYNSVDHKDYLTEDLLSLPFGDNFMSILITDASANKQINFDNSESRLQNIINFIPTDVIKGQYLVAQSRSFKSYDEYTAAVEPNKQYLELDDQIERITTRLTELADSKPGNDFLDFNFVDLAGKEYTKKSFAGKVMVIDFWATWCGPCKQEEPYFEKLADEYQGKEVVFIGISTDKDKKAWEKYVEPKISPFKGIHLHAGNDNILSKAYQVNSIPRYMVIDKQGKIVTINSPRPSNPQLKTVIDKLL